MRQVVPGDQTGSSDLLLQERVGGEECEREGERKRLLSHMISDVQRLREMMYDLHTDPFELEKETNRL